MAVGTLGHLLAVAISPANEQERAQVDPLCQQVQEATAQKVKAAFVDQGYSGQDAPQQARPTTACRQIWQQKLYRSTDTKPNS